MTAPSAKPTKQVQETPQETPQTEELPKGCKTSEE